jgi:hypothetical protein
VEVNAMISAFLQDRPVPHVAWTMQLVESPQ